MTQLGHQITVMYIESHDGGGLGWIYLGVGGVEGGGVGEVMDVVYSQDCKASIVQTSRRNCCQTANCYFW